MYFPKVDFGLRGVCFLLFSMDAKSYVCYVLMYCANTYDSECSAQALIFPLVVLVWTIGESPIKSYARTRMKPFWATVLL